MVVQTPSKTGAQVNAALAATKAKYSSPSPQLSSNGLQEEQSGDFSRANPGLTYTAEDAAQANSPSPATTTGATPPPNNPTTLYSGNVENKYIPDQNSRLEKMSQTGPYNDQNGNSYHANGDLMDTTSDDSDLMNDPSYKLIADLRKKSDATTDAYISSIQDSYKNSLIPQQQNANNADAAQVNNTLLRYGASRTGSGIAANAAVNTAGLQAISDLTSKENQAIAEARQSQQNGDFKSAEDQISIAENLRKDKQAAAKELADEKQAQATAQAKVDAANQKDVNTVLNDAAKNGAPSDVIAAIAAAKDAGSATQVAGEYLQSGEYFDYKRAAQASGATPVDAATYYARKIYGDNSGTNDPFSSGDVPFSSTIQTAAANATSVAGQKSANEQMAQLAKSGDYPALLTRMQQFARQGMTSATRNDTETAESQLGSLTNMADVLKKYQDAGGSMDIFKGTADDIATKLGTLGTDPRYKSLAVQLKAAFQQYRQNMTGAAFGARENADYLSVYPSAGKSFDLNYATIDGLRNYYKENINNAYETQLGSGFNNLKDYVDQGLTPTGKYLLKTESDAKNKLIDLGKTNPAIQNSASSFLKDNPNASAYDVLQFLGIPVATSNEVSINDPSSGIVGGYDIKTYATDPNHEKKVSAIYNDTQDISDATSANAYIKKITPNSPITGSQIMAAANQTGVSPGMILAIIQQDSTFGTAGKAIRTKNPGNVGNTDSGATQSFPDWQSGVLAVANNLAKRKVS